MIAIWMLLGTSRRRLSEFVTTRGASCSLSRQRAAMVPVPVILPSECIEHLSPVKVMVIGTAPDAARYSTAFLSDGAVIQIGSGSLAGKPIHRHRSEVAG
jgi:hypothetical protein